MVAIIDYGVGNLFSLNGSLSAIGAEATITSNPEEIRRASRIILPGVGAFGDAAAKLKSSGMDKIVREQVASGKPLMGICLGMQLLFEKSYEYGEHEGLGLIKGAIRPLKGMLPKEYKTPHVGWNRLSFKGVNPLFKYVKNGDFVYFVHSFYGTDCDESTIAITEYGIPVTAAVARDNVYGCQFHPEKSGMAGLNILRAFCEL